MHGSVDSEVGLLLDHVFCNRLAESLTYAGPSWLLVGLVWTYLLQQFDQKLDSCWTMLDSCWTRLDLCFAAVLRKVGLALKEVGLWLSSFWLVFCKENCALRQTTRLRLYKIQRLGPGSNICFWTLPGLPRAPDVHMSEHCTGDPAS